MTREFNATPLRPLARDYEISTTDPWNYALNTSKGLVFDANASSHGWSPSFAFDDSGAYPFSVQVRNLQVPNPVVAVPRG